ncbi:TadE/TadG family type IV pilus assembly protein [Georgenia muralis]|uniref:Flp pilus assembly protein TadG n=1 Tax=Georgenia muralis TaxID=154117 RepID=A0A3N4ZST6_9MICO|nr:TadE family protein [Georgenia muralis]RPF28578.1 Flp pilus assembly protein TadG [Georgenia muralis]
MTRLPRLRRLMRRGGDRGSSSLEAAIVVPAFFLFVGLLIYAGRTSVAHQGVEAVAYDAARSASIARTHAEAHTRAQAAVEYALVAQGLRCASHDLDVDTSGLDKPVGQPGMVTATVSCTIDLRDLAVPGVPGQATVSATMSAVVDAYRATS